jgi:hypothetical protein
MDNTPTYAKRFKHGQQVTTAGRFYFVQRYQASNNTVWLTSQPGNALAECFAARDVELIQPGNAYDLMRDAENKRGQDENQT